MFAMIALTVVYVIVGVWRKEPVCLYVLNFVLLASAFAAPHVKKVVKKVVKKHGKKVVKKIIVQKVHQKNEYVSTTACVCVYVTFVIAVIITVYNLYVIIKDYVKSYKESR